MTDERIPELEKELQQKQEELNKALDKNEDLEEYIMKLEMAEAEQQSNTKEKPSSKDAKAALELKEKSKEIRELKNKLGFLRKEKIKLQKELDKQNKKKTNGSTVIRIEEKKEPLDVLVNDLQSKINKQRILITKLKKQYMESDGAKNEEAIKEKDEEIKTLRIEINGLNEKLTNLQSQVIVKGPAGDLQKNIESLETELLSILDSDTTGDKKKDSSKVNILNEQISKLKEIIKMKNLQINGLKENISSVQTSSPAFKSPIGTLSEELQNKLNKARIIINTLKDKLSQQGQGMTSGSGEYQEDLEKELRMQGEMVISLQQELEIQKAELQNAINAGSKIKKEYEDLFPEISSRDQEIEQLKSQLEQTGTDPQSVVSTQSTQSEPNIELRLKELSNIIEDLNKQNIQQRIEISEIRKY